MKYYQSYMENQQVSPEFHQKLLSLEVSPKRKAGQPWLKMGALAACCALIFGMWKMAPQEPVSVNGQFATVADSTIPGTKDTYGPGEVPTEEEPIDPYSFIVETGSDKGKLAFPMIPYVAYADVTGTPALDASPCWAAGCFTVDLTKEQVQEIFWGSEGKPEPGHVKCEQGDLPWILMWDGYTVSGSAFYDNQGDLIEAYVNGQRPDGSFFNLTLDPDSLPFQCGLYMDTETTDVRGVEVTGWCLPGMTQCGSEFMSGTVGVRFVNTGASFQVDKGNGWDDVAAAQQFNALFVNWATYDDCSLTLDHLLKADYVPAWRNGSFSSLAEARQETDFAPYLPETGPAGYGEFYGYLTYQEGNHNSLGVIWSRGYDDVRVTVSLPEGDETYETADVNNPASYDMRLYKIPWSESVPEEYRYGFFRDVVFRAEDMSLDIVEARGHEKDTGGMNYHFSVLHDDGTLVEYDCSLLTAQQVWAMVEATL